MRLKVKLRLARYALIVAAVAITVAAVFNPYILLAYILIIGGFCQMDETVCMECGGPGCDECCWHEQSYWESGLCCCKRCEWILDQNE